MRLRHRLSITVAIGLIPASAEAGTRPHLLNLKEMVTADDYPAIAAKNGQEGTAIVSVRVSRDGLVESCKVKKSSGHVALDEQSCAVFRARARFEPARDNSGRAVVGVYERPMTWRLEGFAPPPLPRQAWMIRATLFLSETKILDCKAEAVGVAALPPICPPAKAESERPTEPVVGEMITISHFVPVPYDKAKIPPNAADATFVAQQISELTIEADGLVSRCVAMKFNGEADPKIDFCKVANGYRFDPLPPGSSALTATLVTTGYLKKRTIT